MSRNVKIAGVAALAGVMLAVVAVDALREPWEPSLKSVLPIPEQGEQETRLTRELERCATLTMPDSGCEQAWAANRRRFFGKDADTPAPAANASLPAACNSAGSDDTPANAAIRPELPAAFGAPHPAGSSAP